MSDDPGVTPASRGDDDRSVAQLRMLHSLGATLNALTDVHAIGEAITAELGTLIDYHNCRVYLLQPDGRTLLPIAFRGELLVDFPEYTQETMEELVTEMGEGITGMVAENRTSLLTPDAREVDFAVTIPGTDDDLLESMLAVPMLAGDDVMGVIVLSSLGYGMFDEDDRRLLEVLAAHAGAAFKSAHLLAAEREAARTAAALFAVSQQLTSKRTIGQIFLEALETLPTIVTCRATAAYVRDPDSGAFRLAQLHAEKGVAVRPRAEIPEVPARGRRRLHAERDRAVRHPGRDRGAGAGGTAVPGRGGRHAHLAAAMGSRRLRRDRRRRSHGCLVRRCRRPLREGAHRHHLARPRYGSPVVGARALPRPGGEPGRDVLGGRCRRTRVHLPRWQGRRGVGRGRAPRARAGAAMGRPHRRARPRRGARRLPRRRDPRAGHRLGVPHRPRRGEAPCGSAT